MQIERQFRACLHFFSFSDTLNFRETFGFERE